MIGKIKILEKEALKLLKEAQSLEALLEAGKTYLGRKGPLSSVIKDLNILAPEERALLGAEINAVKTRIEQTLRTLEAKYRDIEKSRRLEKERLDVTLPGRARLAGTFHPV